MAVNEKKTRIKKQIEELSKSEVSIHGHVFDESEDDLTIQIGSTMYEIPKHSIVNTLEKGQEAGKRAVAVTLKDDAKVIQKGVVTTADLAKNAAVYDDDWQCGNGLRRCIIVRCYRCSDYNMMDLGQYATGTFRSQTTSGQ
jgi:hypothetical protein